MASEAAGQERESCTRVSVWDNIQLHTTKWMPQGDVRAVLYLSHGVGTHMGRYNKLGEELAEKGILAFGHDHVGHGKSLGDRVHINDFNTYVQDIINHVKDVKKAYSTVPCFLMGHSMGGLIAVLLAISDQALFAGVVLSGPALEVDPNVVGPILRFLVKGLAYFAPQLGIKPVDPTFISSIPEEVEAYVNDPLVHHMAVKAKWSSEFFHSIDVAREGIHVIAIPALIVHGTQDRLVPLSASQFIFANISSSDKTFEQFEDSFHEVLHDIEQQKARDLIKDWVLSHID